MLLNEILDPRQVKIAAGLISINGIPNTTDYLIDAINTYIIKKKKRGLKKCSIHIGGGHGFFGCLGIEDNNNMPKKKDINVVLVKDFINIRNFYTQSQLREVFDNFKKKWGDWMHEEVKHQWNDEEGESIITFDLV